MTDDSDPGSLDWPGNLDDILAQVHEYLSDPHNDDDCAGYQLVEDMLGLLRSAQLHIDPDRPTVAGLHHGPGDTWYGAVINVPTDGTWQLRRSVHAVWQDRWEAIPPHIIVQARHIDRATARVPWSHALAQQLTVVGMQRTEEVASARVVDGMIGLHDKAGNWLVDVPPDGTVTVLGEDPQPHEVQVR